MTGRPQWDLNAGAHWSLELGSAGEIRVPLDEHSVGTHPPIY
jgi:hypothetical protein